MEGIFSNFEGIADQEWREKVEKDIKGHFQDLLWQDENRLVLQPFYRKSDIADLKNLKDIQAANQLNPDWKIAQLLSWSAQNQDDIHSYMTAAMNAGTDRILLINDSDTGSLGEFLTTNQFDKSTILVQQHCKSMKNFPSKIKQSVLLFDPVGESMSQGVSINIEQSVLGKNTKDFFGNDNHKLLVNGSIYKNAGSNQVQELAYLLQHAVEYLDFFTDQGIEAKEVAAKMFVKVGIGNSFFHEIAKVRALRYLWAKMLSAYKVHFTPMIIAEPSKYYLSVTEPYNNLLRITTQMMSAAFASCDLITSPPFDLSGSANASFSQRMARNMQIILKEESYGNQVQDPGAGSYYIEELTSKLIDAVWEKFLDIEEKDGLSKLYQGGKIQDDISAVHEDRLERMKEEKLKFLGVNIHEEEGTVKPALNNVLNKQHDYPPLEERNLSECYFRKQEKL